MSAAQELSRAAEALEQARAALAALPPESDELRTVKTQITEIGYDADAHTAAQERGSESAALGERPA